MVILMKKLSINKHKSIFYTFAAGICLSLFFIMVFLTLNNSKVESKEIGIEAELVSLNSDFGPRDHESLLLDNGKIYMYGGFFRGDSTYQNLLTSTDNGRNFSTIVGGVFPRNNDLSKHIIPFQSDLPSGYARFLKWNSRLYLVDRDLWLIESNSITKVTENFLPELNSAAELNILKTESGILFIDLALGRIWTFTSDLKMTSNTEFKHEGKVIKVKGATVFENNGVYFIYGGQLLGEGYDNSPRISHLNLKSADGISWAEIQVPQSNPFSSLIWPCSISDKESRTWIFGGYNLLTQENSNQAWVSKDGFNFSQVAVWEKGNKFFPRHAPGCIYLEKQNSILVLGGKGGENESNDTAWVMNDVWNLKLP